MSGTFNLPQTLLGGEAFVSLAELVADLTEKKDLSSGAEVGVGMTYTEMANLVDAFGLPTMVKLARKDKLDVSASSLMYALPMDKIQALSAPVVIGRDLGVDLATSDGETLAAGSDKLIAALFKGYADISTNMTGEDNEIVNDLSVALGSGYEFPNGPKLNAINWTDLSSVSTAKNIRFDSASAVSDVSAIFDLFHTGSNTERELNYVTGADPSLNFDIGTDSAVTEHNHANRSRDYLNFLNLMTPIPSFKEIKEISARMDNSFCVGPYLEAGLFKNEVGLGKTYLTTAAALKNEIRYGATGISTRVNQMSVNPGVAAANLPNLTNEFAIMKNYGFTSSKVADAYAAELAYGLVAATGVAGTSAVPGVSIQAIQDNFALVFGSTGGLVDQVTDYGAIEVFDDSEGFKYADISRATGIASFADFIAQVKAFIESDPDHNWSSQGIVAPTTYIGSAKETWDKHKARLASDPRLSKFVPLSAAKDEALRILLESTDNVHNNYAKNDISLSFGSGAAGAILDVNGKLVNVDGTDLGNTIFALAAKHGWTDYRDIIGDRNGSSLFMMDDVYNVRSRIPELDMVGNTTNVTDLEFAKLKNAGLAAGRHVLQNNKLHQTFAADSPDGIISNFSANDISLSTYFTPANFQSMFFDYTDLQHTANVALRYFDLSSVGSSAADISANMYMVNGVTVFRNTFRHLDADIQVRPTKYDVSSQEHPLDWVYGVLVKGSFQTAKQALAEITSWSPVPPALYVDVSDVTGFVENATRITRQTAAGVLGYVDADAEYDNRSLPGCMTHVMANYLIRKDSSDEHLIEDHEIIDLLELHPDETIKALSTLSTGADTTGEVTLNTITHWTGSAATSIAVSTTSSTEVLTRRILKLLVVYGKSVGLFNTILGTKGPRVAIDSYEEEVIEWADKTDNTLALFGEGNSAFLANQHLSYWIPYLQQFTPAQIANEVALDDDILNTSAQAQTLMLGLLLAATKGNLGSSSVNGAATRVAGLNAFYDAGVPKAFIDIAWTAKGTNTFTNLSGSKYGADM
uniref:Uncharacterized protein n=1 Tax=viral metagenome TaxID=1070528 RepID=A0A6C0LUC8_9ZZZZ